MGLIRSVHFISTTPGYMYMDHSIWHLKLQSTFRSTCTWMTTAKALNFRIREMFIFELQIAHLCICWRIRYLSLLSFLYFINNFNVLQVSRGLHAKYGDKRVIDTPITEVNIVFYQYIFFSSIKNWVPCSVQVIFYTFETRALLI